MRATLVIAVACLLAFSQAAKTTIKQKLAEKGNKLAQAGAQAEAGCWPCWNCNGPYCD